MNDDERDALLGSIGTRMFDITRALRRSLARQTGDKYRISDIASDIMMIVTNVPGVSVGRISRTTGVQMSNTSATISMLIERGLVTKQAAPGNGREIQVFPTDLAYQYLTDFHELWAERLSADAGYDEHELRTVLAYLDRAFVAVGALPVGDGPSEPVG